MASLALAAAGCLRPSAAPGRQALQNAFVAVAETGEAPLVERFLRADPSLKASVARRTSSFAPRHALAAAAKGGRVEVVRLLLDQGLPANPPIDNFSHVEPSPLHFAAEEGHLDVARLLLERGARVDARDQDGSTPLREAARRGRLALIPLLVEGGADVDATDKYGRTALWDVASNSWELRGLGGLCAAGADPSRRDKDGRTAGQEAEAALAKARADGYRANDVATRARAAAFLRPGGPCDDLRARRAREGPPSPERLEVDFREFECAQGDLDACGRAGMAWDDAKGVPEDFARARGLYERGCQGDDEFSCSRLGHLYVAGDGVPKDLGRGAQLYDKACRLGSAWSCARLGEFYLQGQGVPRDRERARGLLKQACEAKRKDERACQEYAGLQQGGGR